MTPTHRTKGRRGVNRWNEVPRTVVYPKQEGSFGKLWTQWHLICIGLLQLWRAKMNEASRSQRRLAGNAQGNRRRLWLRAADGLRRRICGVLSVQVCSQYKWRLFTTRVLSLPPFHDAPIVSAGEIRETRQVQVNPEVQSQTRYFSNSQHSYRVES